MRGELQIITDMLWTHGWVCSGGRGAKVVQIPFRIEGKRWADIQGDMDSRIEYLTCILEANGVEIDAISQL